MRTQSIFMKYNPNKVNTDSVAANAKMHNLGEFSFEFLYKYSSIPILLSQKSPLAFVRNITSGAPNLSHADFLENTYLQQRTFLKHW